MQIFAPETEAAKQIHCGHPMLLYICSAFIHMTMCYVCEWNEIGKPEKSQTLPTSGELRRIDCLTILTQNKLNLDWCT